MNKQLMMELLDRMSRDESGRLPATTLLPAEEHAANLLENLELAEWVGNYPYGYRITARGYDALAKGELPS